MSALTMAVFSVVAIAGSPDGAKTATGRIAADELLPPTPADWRYEKLEFPLSFAPELPYQGFEELRFAPGMFNEESDTYWTYIFALKINGSLPPTAQFIKDFLETYYRGLCKAVAEGTEYEIDADKIVAEVGARSVEGGTAAKLFQATLKSYDPFVTGKPIDLNLRIAVITLGKDDHRVFAAVSPRSINDAIWKLLSQFEAGFIKKNKG